MKRNRAVYTRVKKYFPTFFYFYTQHASYTQTLHLSFFFIFIFFYVFLFCLFLLHMFHWTLLRFHRWTDVNLYTSFLWLCIFLISLIVSFRPQQRIYYTLAKGYTTLYYIACWTTFSCTVLFWTIYLSGYTELLQPSHIVIPFSTHFYIHLFPFLSVVISGWYIPKSWRQEIGFDFVWIVTTQVILLTCYFLNLYYIRQKFNYFPYPFMDNCTLFNQVQLVFVSIALSLVCTDLGDRWIRRYLFQVKYVSSPLPESTSSTSQKSKSFMTSPSGKYN